MGKNSGYFVIDNGSEQCTIRIVPGSHLYGFFFDEDKAKMYNVTKMENGKLQREYLFLGNGSFQYTGGGWKGNHSLRYHLCLILEDVDLKGALALEYVNWM